MKITRQADYYPTEASRQHSEQVESHQRYVNLAARKNNLPSHLVNGPGIGRLGVDPRL